MDCAVAVSSENVTPLCIWASPHGKTKPSMHSQGQNFWAKQRLVTTYHVCGMGHNLGKAHMLCLANA